MIWVYQEALDEDHYSLHWKSWNIFHPLIFQLLWYQCIYQIHYSKCAIVDLSFIKLYCLADKRFINSLMKTIPSLCAGFTRLVVLLFVFSSIVNHWWSLRHFFQSCGIHLPCIVLFCRRAKGLYRWPINSVKICGCVSSGQQELFKFSFRISFWTVWSVLFILNRYARFICFFFENASKLILKNIHLFFVVKFC